MYIYIARAWCVESGEERFYMQYIIDMVWCFLYDCYHISYVGFQGRIYEIIKQVLFLLEMIE